MTYPGFHGWRARRSAALAGWSAACGFGAPFARSRAWEEGLAAASRFGEPGGGAFGVRRPLRFLAYKLDLDERQVGELAKVLAELKTERAQAEVDARRALVALADAVGAERFDEGRAKEAGDVRVAAAERLREAVSRALARIHAVLDPEQRERLAYLIRTGTLVL